MRRTCAKCGWLQLHANSVQGLAVAKCGRTGNIVPQNTRPIEVGHWREWRTVFWRVPTECPLPATMVEKSKHQQPMHLWETQTWRVPAEAIQ